MLTVTVIEVTDFIQNCRILSWGAGDAVVIDPGGDVRKVLLKLEQLKLNCREIWLTHSHLDHCGGVAGLKAATSARLIAHPAENVMRAHVDQIARMYGLPAGVLENCPEPEEPVLGGETLYFNQLAFEVLFTPGHSPGHVCFYCREENLLLAGDTVFAGSIGRTDLPGGDHEQLLTSIREKILTLPDETRVLPGHGPDTTVGAERRSNPFLQDKCR